MQRPTWSCLELIFAIDAYLINGILYQEYSPYFGHKALHQYFKSYAEHFMLEQHIFYNTRVVRVERTSRAGAVTRVLQLCLTSFACRLLNIFAYGGTLVYGLFLRGVNEYCTVSIYKSSVWDPKSAIAYEIVVVTFYLWWPY